MSRASASCLRALVVVAVAACSPDVDPSGGTTVGTAGADGAAADRIETDSGPGEPPQPRARVASSEPAAAAADEPTDTELPQTPKALADLLLAETLAGQDESDARDALAAHGAAALSEFIRLLASERHASWACVRIQELGETGAPAASALAKCIVELRARGPAAWALVCIGDAGAAAALPLVGSEDTDVRIAALDVIGRCGRVPVEGEPTLLRAAADPEPAIRRIAAFALRAVGADRPGAVTVLCGLLEDDERSVRSAALDTLLGYSAEIGDRAAQLVAHAERCEDDVRGVVKVLDAIGPAALLVGLASPAPDVRADCAAFADPSDHAIRARLVELLSDDASDVVAVALDRLARLDEPPPEAARAAAAILGEPLNVPATTDARVYLVARNARLDAITVIEGLIRRGERPVDALLPTLEHRDRDIRAAAAIALVRSAPAADLDRVVSAVRPVWRDERNPQDLRVEVAAEVGARQGAGSETVPWLARYAERGDVQRVEAIAALGRIADPAAVDVLLGQLDVVIRDVRVAAVTALGGHVTTDARVVPALVKELRTANRPEFRAAAAAALAPVRSREDVRAALDAARKDPAADVRTAVEAVLEE